MTNINTLRTREFRKLHPDYHKEHQKIYNHTPQGDENIVLFETAIKYLGGMWK